MALQPIQQPPHRGIELRNVSVDAGCLRHSPLKAPKLPRQLIQLQHELVAAHRPLAAALSLRQIPTQPAKRSAVAKFKMIQRKRWRNWKTENPANHVCRSAALQPLFCFPNHSRHCMNRLPAAMAEAHGAIGVGDAVWAADRQEVRALAGPGAGHAVRAHSRPPCFAQGWIAATVVELHGDRSVQVETSAGERHTVAVHGLLARARDRMVGSAYEADMDDLPHQHEAEVLHNIRVRFARDLIYTRAGPILVAVNPFKPLPLFTRRVMQSNRSATDPSRAPPHCYAVAETALRRMLTGQRNQSLVVCGESGAGKTETTKAILAYYADAATGTRASPGAPTAREIAERITESNPVLEAFGNAMTVRNDNSRCGGRGERGCMRADHSSLLAAVRVPRAAQSLWEADQAALLGRRLPLWRQHSELPAGEVALRVTQYAGAQLPRVLPASGGAGRAAEGGAAAHGGGCFQLPAQQPRRRTGSG